MSSAEEQLTDELILKHEHEHAQISVVKDKPVAIVIATSNYISIDEFQEIFRQIGELVKDQQISKLVFDKRALTVFHQPSMEWYFTDWKEKMWDFGLKTHRKILPDNKVFQQSVRIGREKIKNDHPTLKFNQMDIQYKNDLQTAIDE